MSAARSGSNKTLYSNTEEHMTAGRCSLFIAACPNSLEILCVAFHTGCRVGCPFQCSNLYPCQRHSP
jgi:hypothetical protein